MDGPAWRRWTGQVLRWKHVGAQDRHLRQELLLAESQATYNLSLVMLRKATGELLQSEQVTWMEYHEYCESLRTRVLTKPSTIPGMAD